VVSHKGRQNSKSNTGCHEDSERMSLASEASWNNCPPGCCDSSLSAGHTLVTTITVHLSNSFSLAAIQPSPAHLHYHGNSTSIRRALHYTCRRCAVNHLLKFFPKFAQTSQGVAIAGTAPRWRPLPTCKYTPRGRPMSSMSYRYESSGTAEGLFFAISLFAGPIRSSRGTIGCEPMAVTPARQRHEATAPREAEIKYERAIL